MRPLRLPLAACHLAVLLAAGSMRGQVPEAPAPATYTGVLRLVRHDMPVARSDGYAPTRQLAKRVEGESAVDWPEMTLGTQPVFRNGPEEKVPLTLRKGGEAASLFQAPSDYVIQPGNHWFRAIDWRWGRKHLYTADATARTANAAASDTGRYELWTFPVRLRGEGGPVIKGVLLRTGGTTIYKKYGPWRSLTLLLPASEPGKPYELSVDGRPPVQFEAGVLAPKLGQPQERTFAFHIEVKGEGPKIFVESVDRPTDFPHAREWAEDLAALSEPLSTGGGATGSAPAFPSHPALVSPRSPMTLYAMALPHGMSGGFYKQGGRDFSGSVAQYAEHIASLGLNTVFEQANTLPAPADGDSFERRAVELARHGVRMGLQYDNNWSRPSLQHPNLAFFAHTLPDWHAPLYRSLSLAAQRFSGLPNFAGFSIGSDNGGYTSYWHWAPPIPDRPWGEALASFTGSRQPKIPRAKSLGSREFAFEQPGATTADFLKYVTRFETAHQQYGYFSEAIREVDPALVLTTGSFGSSPGTGGRGGWPWASIPGRVMFESMPVQQAYDWNETRAAKPMHSIALIDRLRSYHPRKKTWALIDNFQLLYGREAYQRACALALTRGIQGVGTNFLPPPGDAKAEAAAYVQEMNGWIQRYGGVYARTEPLPAIGIFYGHHQAVQKRVLTGDQLPPDQAGAGSHEGMVTEALFLCHAAGWPARVVTYQEIARGSLPTGMSALLLVGLDQADPTWHWARGLEKPLEVFAARGGKILADAKSFCPVPCTRPGLQVAAYQPQSNMDPTPLLLARNAENISTLQAAMASVPKPVVTSTDPTLWALPAQCGDTQYVTVVNQASAGNDVSAEMIRPADPKAGKPEPWKTKANASLFVPPRTGAVAWNTDRPIYDVRLCRKLTLDEASRVDLTTDGFRWYALPPAEVVAPEVKVTKTRDGGYEAVVEVKNPAPMSGIPVSLRVTKGSESFEVSLATGHPAPLPVRRLDADGEYTLVATELLSGLSTSHKLQHTGPADGIPPVPPVQIRQPRHLAKFAARKHVALTIALTPQQREDKAMLEHARTLETHFRAIGRIASIGRIEPGGIVEGLQPLRSPHRYPQWKTTPTDLVLFGTTSSNILLRDQARGQILRVGNETFPAGRAEILYTQSPFVGEYDAINIIAPDAAGMDHAVKALVRSARPEVKLAR